MRRWWIMFLALGCGAPALEQQPDAPVVVTDMAHLGAIYPDLAHDDMAQLAPPDFAHVDDMTELGPMCFGAQCSATQFCGSEYWPASSMSCMDCGAPQLLACRVGTDYSCRSGTLVNATLDAGGVEFFCAVLSNGVGGAGQPCGTITVYRVAGDATDMRTLTTACRDTTLRCSSSTCS